MKQPELMVTLELRWWVVPYLQSVGFFARVFGLEPDVEKIRDFLMAHGFRGEVVR